jgi:SHR-binding domain of vacuolar-sorting associated protein 13
MARYDVNVHVAIGSNPFASSKLVTFAPAVVLCNASNATMHVQQYHSNKLLTLEPGHSQPLIWFNPDAKPELLVQPVSCEAVQWAWSGRFTVSEVSSHALRIHSKNDPSHFTILPVSVTTQVCALFMCTMALPLK